MAKILAIGGSDREYGNTNNGLRLILERLSREGIETELVTLCNKEIKIGTCATCPSTCHNRAAVCIEDDDFQEIFKKMLEADGIILGAPVYWGSMPAKLMAVLGRAGNLAEGRVSADKPVPDRSTWPAGKGAGLFKRKLGAVISSTRRTGANFTLSQAWSWFFLLDFTVVGSTYWPVGVGQPIRVPIVEDGEVIMKATGRPRHPMDQVDTDEEYRHTLLNLADNIAWFIKKCYT